jgi:hypothetical protein
MIMTPLSFVAAGPNVNDLPGPHVLLARRVVVHIPRVAVA